MKRSTPEIENHLATLRQKRGLPAARLAEMVGASRQTIYAMEAGTYMPNTALALRLARALEVKVEDLFALPGEIREPDLRPAQALLLEGATVPHSGQLVQLCRVDDRLIAAEPSPVRWYFPSSDAVVTAAISSGEKARVGIYRAEAEIRNRILVAGCDPGISVLARHAQAAGVEMVLVHRNSSQALELLKDGHIHVAGTHLRDELSGESNLPEIGRIFARRSVAVISFAVWEEGLVTAPGNPKRIASVEDLARRDVTTVNREAGAGSRRLLDARLRAARIDPDRVRGYGSVANGHLPAAWQVRTGAADCCVATRGAARLFGLGFIPLATERYDLAVRRRHLDDARIQALFDTLTRADFRRELENIGGYDTAVAGRRLL
jgi:molybdopterin molybdotransferase/putative molybdopterin biosynthesis protein